MISRRRGRRRGEYHGTVATAQAQKGRRQKHHLAAVGCVRLQVATAHGSPDRLPGLVAEKARGLVGVIQRRSHRPPVAIIVLGEQSGDDLDWSVSHSGQSVRGSLPSTHPRLATVPRHRRTKRHPSAGCVLGTGWHRFCVGGDQDRSRGWAKVKCPRAPATVGEGNRVRRGRNRGVFEG